MVLGRVFAPHGLDRLGAVAHHLEAILEHGAVVLHLLGVPPRPDAELEAPAGQQVEGRALLGEHDGIALGEQRDRGTDAKRLRRRGGVGESDEGVDGVLVLLRQLRAARPRAPAAGGDVGVLGHEERFESAVLALAGELVDADGVVGGELGDAYVHGVDSEVRSWNEGRISTRNRIAVRARSSGSEDDGAGIRPCRRPGSAGLEVAGEPAPEPAVALEQAYQSGRVSRRTNASTASSVSSGRSR